MSTTRWNLNSTVKFLLIICGLFLVYVAGYSQTSIGTITGRVVYDESGEAAAGVVVTAQAIDSDSVLGYSITDRTGTFAIEINSTKREVRLTVSSMNVEPVTRIVDSKTSDLEIIVHEKKLVLDEVKVVAQKIVQLGDTLNYNVASFNDSSDRSIGDVLKKLPGIYVSPSGKVFYQDKEISKFYIDGLDLLQGRYGLATNNLDVSKVATVQVLENHQPIKVLEGMEIPETAAINLKLKSSSRGAFFMTAQAGLGTQAGPFGDSYLFSNELIGMRFTSNQQNLLLIKNDNTGRDIVRELTSYYGSSMLPTLDIFDINEMNEPDIDLQHYLRNEAYVVSANDLQTLRSDFTLTGNLNYYDDTQSQDGQYQKVVHIGNGNEDVIIREDISSMARKQELSGTLTVEKNVKNYYLTNKTNFNVNRNGESNTLVSLFPVSQSIGSPSLFVENQFRRIKNKWSLMSSVFFSKQNKTLSVNRVIFDDLSHLDSIAVQGIDYKQFEFDFTVGKQIELSSKGSFTFYLSPFLNRYSLSSEMFSGPNEVPINTDSLTNNLNRSEFGFDTRFEVRYQTSSISMFLDIPIQFLYLNRQNLLMNFTGNSFQVIPSPFAYIELKKTPFLFRVDASYSKILPDIQDETDGFIMSSYRNLSRGNGVLPEVDQHFYRGLVSYKDIASSFFGSLSGIYQHNLQNYLSCFQYNGICSSITNILYDNSSDIVSASLQLGTDIPAINSTVKVNASLNESKSLVINNGAFVDYSAKSYSVGTSIFTTLDSWLTIQYDALFRNSGSIVATTTFDPMKYLKQIISLSISPIKNGEIDLTFDHYYNNQPKQNQSVYFGNIGLSYRIKKAEISLDWTNVFNTERLYSYYYSETSSYRSTYILRPSELLLKIKFSIL